MKKIDFPSHSKYRKKFEQNNNRTALNILFVPRHTEEIILAYKSKHNFNRENQVILLMITDGKKWHYLTVKSLSALLKGITSNHKVEFYCLDCFHSYSTKENLQKHEKVCNNHDYCFVEMPNDDNKILKYNYGEKPLKLTAIIYVDVECLLEKIHSCQIILKNVTHRNKLSIYLLVTHCLQIIKLIQKKTSLIITKDCMESFCKDLKEHETKIMNYEKKRNNTIN